TNGTDKLSKDTTNNEDNKLDISSSDNTTLDMLYIPINKHITPELNTDIEFNFKVYDALYNGPTKDCQKTLYIKFDVDYENGNT
ncbi:polysaccharide deacetylase, partial [Clostridioides difficile]|nr:polysaccharide deacetylase [Clostridioides difficile]